MLTAPAVTGSEGCRDSEPPHHVHRFQEELLRVPGDLKKTVKKGNADNILALRRLCALSPLPRTSGLWD